MIEGSKDDREKRNEKYYNDALFVSDNIHNKFHPSSD